MDDLMRNIPIVFSVNENYCGKLAVVINSILANSNSSFDFYILSTGISIGSIEKLRRVLLNGGGDPSRLYVLDISKFIGEDLTKYLSRRDGYTYISVETYYRFYIHKVLPDLDKVIYLDADLLVLGDIADLYKIELKDVYAGVVADMWVHFCCQKSSFNVKTRKGQTIENYIRNDLGVRGREYFNAGVMLLNLKKIREETLDKRLLRFVKNNSPLEFQDQDALNAIFGDHIIYCDLSWNVLKDVCSIERGLDNSTFKQKLIEARLNPKVVHFTGKNKPWCVDVLEYDHIKEWWKFYLDTEFCTKEDRGRYVRILSSEKFKRYRSYFVLKFKNYEIVHVYRKDFRYSVVLFGKLIARKTIRWVE